MEESHGHGLLSVADIRGLEEDPFPEEAEEEEAEVEEAAEDFIHDLYPLLRNILKDVPRCDFAISYAFLSCGDNCSR